MLNQCKTTALIQIECIHYRNFVEKKKKKNKCFSIEKYQKSAPSIVIDVIFFKKSTVIGTVLTFFAKYPYRYCRYGRYF